MERQPGDKLGPYELVSPIGKGGMGEVWKARDTRLHRDVAVKFCSSRFSDRFLREARAIAALNHPNICTLHDIGPDYLVMEYIEGTPPRGPLAAAEATRLALGIAAAIEAAHEKEITHRDLKPANILVTRAGVKLLDFGLALVHDNSGIGTGDAPTALSVAGSVMGTVAYMSPEQAQGKPIDARSDIFSFGLVLYELLSGRQAFPSNSAVETMAAIIREEAAPLDTSPKLAEIVARCLRKSAAARFQTMSEVRVALEQATAVRIDKDPSIAVLPFANMSRDADDEYFSDGLAEEILNVLTHIPGLKVTARTSSFAFRGKEQDIRGIAEALGVRTILEGSVRRAGSRIRVTAQLINAADGYHLWSERYDREMTDVFAVQDEIATAIAGALHVKLTGKQATARQYEPNLPAWEAFLKGRHQSYNYSQEAFGLAQKFLKQAIELDPRWALPHSFLGLQYWLVGSLGLRPMSEMAPLARAEVRKAVELLPSEPMAHALLGGIAAVHDYDWKEATEQFRLAMESEPLSPDVYGGYAQVYLVPLGRFAEALQEYAKAIAQDPLNPRWRTAQAFALQWAEVYEPAIAEARTALDFGDPSFLPHLVISESCFFQGKLTEAREPAEEAFRLAPWHPRTVGFLAGVLVQSGETDRAEKLIATLSEKPDGMMMYHFLCSEFDAAIDCYERVIELRLPVAAMLASAGFLKPLRASPRWARLARMMNLPKENVPVP